MVDFILWESLAPVVKSTFSFHELNDVRMPTVIFFPIRLQERKLKSGPEELLHMRPRISAYILHFSAPGQSGRT